MNHYLKYISNIIWLEDFLQYEICRNKPLAKTITIIDKDFKSEYIYDLIYKTWVQLQKPNINILNHYIAVHDHQKWGLGKNIYHEAGYFYVQETSAALPAGLLDIKSWDIVLDVCASPGGKTIQIANILSKIWDGILVSNEFDRNRQQVLTKNIQKYWLANIISTGHDTKYISKNLPETFDHILVDAPCSGEGTCHRDTRFLKHRSLDLINKNAKLQFQILQDMYISLKLGGSMIYSTCTLNPIENEWVVAKFLAAYSDINLVDLSRVWLQPGMLGHWLDIHQTNNLIRLFPHKNQTGGFFVAKFEKISQKVLLWDDTNILTEKYTAQIQNFLKYIYNKFGINISQWQFYQKDEYIYYYDFGKKNEKAKLLSNQIYKSTLGVIIAKINFKWYILTHTFAKLFGKFATKSLVKISDIHKIEKLFSDGTLDGDDAQIIGNNIIDNQYIYIQSDNNTNIYLWIGKVLANGLKFNT